MRKDVKHEGRTDGRTDGRTIRQAGRHGEANSRSLRLSKTPKEILEK